MKQLIECVRKYPFLYDRNEENYKNTVLKIETWERIGRELNESDKMVKIKWKNLRDNYVRHKKLLKRDIGRSTRELKWPWYSHLQFLDATLTHLTSSTNSQQGGSSGLKTPFVQIPLNTTSTTHTSASSTSTTSKRCYELEAGETIIDCLKMKKMHSLDSTDHLFLSYADTFKKFSERSKIMLKVELAKLFADTEFKEMEQQLQPSVHSTTYSATCSDFHNAIYSQQNYLQARGFNNLQEATQSGGDKGGNFMQDFKTDFKTEI